MVLKHFTTICSKMQYLRGKSSMVNAVVEICLKATSQTNTLVEIFETLRYQAYNVNLWKGDYLRKDVVNIGRQF